MSINLLIVHRDKLCSEGLAAALTAAQPELSADLVTSPIEAAARLADRQLDLLLVDWHLPPAEALGLVRVAVRTRPRLCVIVYGVPESDAQTCYAAGCGAVIQRSEGLDTLLARIADRGTPPAAKAPRAEATGEGCAPLTARQKQILELIDQGLSNKEIARRLGLSLHTVKNHIHNLLTKLNVESRYRAVESVPPHLRARLAPGPARPQSA